MARPRTDGGWEVLSRRWPVISGTGCVAGADVERLLGPLCVVILEVVDDGTGTDGVQLMRLCRPASEIDLRSLVDSWPTSLGTSNRLEGRGLLEVVPASSPQRVCHTSTAGS